MRASHAGDGQTKSSRVCVVDSKDLGAAYPRLDECDFEVMAALPSLAHLTARDAAGYDVVVVGCSERMLLSPAFRRRVRQLCREARLVAVLPEPNSVASADAARIGFTGLVGREVSPAAVDRTIAAVARGETAFPRHAANALIEFAFGRGAMGPRLAGPSLTPRQEQVVALIAQGATDREIARLLRISESTAHKHVQNALRRFRAKTRSQLVASAHLGSLVERRFGDGSRGSRAPAP